MNQFRLTQTHRVIRAIMIVLAAGVSLMFVACMSVCVADNLTTADADIVMTYPAARLSAKTTPTADPSATGSII